MRSSGECRQTREESQDLSPETHHYWDASEVGGARRRDRRGTASEVRNTGPWQPIEFLKELEVISVLALYSSRKMRPENSCQIDQHGGYWLL